MWNGRIRGDAFTGVEGMNSLGWSEVWKGRIGGDAVSGVDGMHSLGCGVEGQNWR